MTCLIFSDLDDTLITSYNKYYDYGNIFCDKLDNPLVFKTDKIISSTLITKKHQFLYNLLTKNKEILPIPVTARTISGFDKLNKFFSSLSEYPQKYNLDNIVCNYGSLIVSKKDNKYLLNKDYYDYQINFLDKNNLNNIYFYYKEKIESSLKEIGYFSISDKNDMLKNVLDIENINNYKKVFQSFIKYECFDNYIYSEDGNLKHYCYLRIDFIYDDFFNDLKMLSFLKEIIDNPFLKIVNVRKNVFILILETNTKKFAVNYLINVMNKENKSLITLGCGNSIDDFGFISLCDFQVITNIYDNELSKFIKEKIDEL